MTTLRISKIVLVSLVAFSALAQQTATLESLSVCELLRDAPRYNGQRISLRGVYHRGGHGELFLRGEGCEGILKTGGYVWENLIYIDDRLPEAQRLMEKFNAAVALERERMGPQTRTWKIWITFAGKFVTEDPLKLFPSSRSPMGFGPFFASPGQLFIDDMLKVEFEIQ